MKNVRNIALIAIVAFAALAIAGPIKVWHTPMQAAEHHQPVKVMLRHYQRDGFELYEAYENAFRYFAEPVGDHTWGTVVFRLKKSAGDYSLETTYVTLTATIDYLANEDGFQCASFDVTEETVY